jgi:choline-sulfatase
MARPPDIIWIYCDELRTDALGCYGNPWTRMQTPHLDALAARGQRYANCFCSSPLCVPSRVAVLTGLPPEETGVYANEGAWPRYRLEREVTTFPEVFAAAGYRTADFGKQHLCPGMDPWQERCPDGADQGGLVRLLKEEGRGAFAPPGLRTPISGVIPREIPYPPEQLTERALAWLDAAPADRPYLVRLSYLQPHTPVCPPEPYDRLYDPECFPGSREEAGQAPALERRFAEVIRGRALTPEQVRLAQAHYYGLVAWVDAQVGRVVELLRRRGRLANTVILFTADHGASLGEGGCYAKHTFAPQVHRVPLLLAGPGVEPTAARPDLADSLDVARTLFGLAGVAAPASFRGRDLLQDPAPEAVYSTIGYGFAESRAFPNLDTGELATHAGWPRRSCVRTDRYRYDRNVRLEGRPPATPAERDAFLCDWQADPEERHNLLDRPACAAVRQRLEALLCAHIAGAEEPPQAYTRRG